MSLISLLALIVGILSGMCSIISFIYSFKSNIYSVFVSTKKLDAIYGDSIKVIIRLTNESANGLELTDLKLLKNGKQIEDNGYSYRKARSVHDNLNKISNNYFNLEYFFDDYTGVKENEQKSSSYNFEGTWLFPKNGMCMECSYWIDKNELPDTLEITTNKRLRLFSKTKRYSIFSDLIIPDSDI
ncbi:hypothetical protein [Apilactobacillus kunkeei]|uniref:hypothetical protein n=1 Tax=Apilactobacillus kunkeei TaxID=148814 RepID=UPI00112E58C8|nr:hypothetical protein [Apilactobacillus kunkeei]TPR53186.1 hypothetical protein DY036_07095 [Apilactobacillus kunkeei]